MKNWILITILLFTAIGLSCQGGSKPLPSEIPFLRDFQAAKAEAAKTQKPMIIAFYADTSWCDYCKQLDTLTFKDSLIIAMSNDNIFVKINAEVDTALASRFAISGFPTVVVTKPDGSEIDRIQGFVDANEFYNQVNLYLIGKETLEDYLTRLEDEADNQIYLTTIAEKYTDRSEFAKAIEFYNKVIALDPENIRGYAAKGLLGISGVQGISKDYAAAIATCQDIIKRFPTSPEADDASAMLGYYTAKSGDETGALTIYRDYLQKYPEGRNRWVQERLADLEEKL